MLSSRQKAVAGIMIVIVVLLLAACSSAANTSNTSTTGTRSTSASTTAPVFSTPQQVIPKATGTPGKGPLVISSPTALPGNKTGGQQVVLTDRTLIINRVTEQKGASATILVSLDLAVQNTGNKAIMNLSTFFQLMGPEGDSFGYQYDSTDTFYGTIAAHSSRSGTIVFQVPASVAKLSLQLLYRPEIAQETAIILLKLS